MAQYKVPQDVEAEDRLLGPFTFRQFIYLIITAASIAACWGFLQIFPLLALIPLPLVIFFAILALPIKKDQPMETYLAAIVNFYLKPRKRLWTPGQKESSILITAPKVVEKPRTRDITEEEASHRLSFLAELVDTEGYSIRGTNQSSMKEEYVAEANTVVDILDSRNPTSSNININNIINQKQDTHHSELVAKMRLAIERTEEIAPSTPLTINKRPFASTPPPTKPSPATPSPSMINLAHNPVYSVQTISQQASRLQTPNQINPNQINQSFPSSH